MHLTLGTLIWVVIILILVIRLGRLFQKRRGGARAAPSPAAPRRRIIKNSPYVGLRGLTIASMKMYFRNRTALFFSLFFPVVFITVFGFIFKDSSTSLKIDLTNHSQTQIAQQAVAALHKVSVFKIKNTSEAGGATDLNKGNTDLTVIIPADFGQLNHGRLVPAQITVHYNQASPQNGEAGAQIIQQLVSSFNDQINHTPETISVAASGVKTKNLTYIDFLLPGMVGLSIMQLGIFSVAFSLVSYKTTGALRRLQATPIHPSSFLTAQAITRLIVAVLQSTVLVGLGIILFSFHLASGSWLPFLVLALIGSAVFQAFGFAIAGWAKNEDQAQPVTQLLTFPMMFLSGTFFSRDSFPHLLQVITGYLPLTYLADALRQVANNGASLWVIRGDLLGLLVWGIVAGLVAIRLFSWE